MYCRNCGTENKDDAQRCLTCGEFLQVPQQPQQPRPPQTPQQGPYSGGSQGPYSGGSPGIAGGYKAQTTSGLAITSLVLGILGFFTCITAPIGLILGIVSLGQIKNSSGRVGGNGFAIAGIILAVVAMLINVVLWAVMFPVFSRAMDAAQRQHSQLFNSKPRTYDVARATTPDPFINIAGQQFVVTNLNASIKA